jgi:hypothetical protein
MFKRTRHPICFTARNADFASLGAPTGDRAHGLLDNLFNLSGP